MDKGQYYGDHAMMMKAGSMTSSSSSLEEDHQSSEDDQMMTTTMTSELRRGPWTVEEDLTLMNYISNHGEGRWNSLARCAGLKRTGKSCRLRWLNYLRPDVRRGNITLEEQLLILELHSRWGNRWSKIAQHLPGRTDNEIKNYWRTRVQKHAKQLKCDVNSKQFKDTMRYLWMPRLVERINASSSSSSVGTTAQMVGPATTSSFTPGLAQLGPTHHYNYNTATPANPNNNNSAQDYYVPDHQYADYFQPCINDDGQGVMMINGGDQIDNSTQASLDHHFQAMESQYDLQSEMSLWNNVDDIWFLQQQLHSNGL